LSVPLANKGSFQKICDLVPARDGWKTRHREFLRQAFRGAPHIDAAIDLFDRVYANERFINLLTASIEETSLTVGLTRPSRWLAASQLGIGGESWARVLAIVQAVGGTRYVTAHGAANYLDHEAFERAGVTVEYVDYSKTPYAQLHEPFTAFVSVLDAIANLGASAGAVLRPKTIPWRKFVVERTHRDTRATNGIEAVVPVGDPPAAAETGDLALHSKYRSSIFRYTVVSAARSATAVRSSTWCMVAPTRPNSSTGQ
jgi:WbqC-like protein family